MTRDVEKKYTEAGTELKHKWSCYVKLVDKKLNAYQQNIIEAVKMEVNPNFNVPTEVIKPKKGELIRMSGQTWCWFDVELTIYWKTDTGRVDPYTITHTLTLEGSGAKHHLRLKFDGNKLKKVCRSQ